MKAEAYLCFYEGFRFAQCLRPPEPTSTPRTIAGDVTHLPHGVTSRPSEGEFPSALLTNQSAQTTFMRDECIKDPKFA
jgi:hypothetical protein